VAALAIAALKGTTVSTYKTIEVAHRLNPTYKTTLPLQNLYAGTAGDF
jgi:hypothetical protein